MTEVTYYVAMSLDGFIATRDGSVDWLNPFNSETEDYGFRKFVESMDAIIFGSKTYEQALGFGEWPHPEKRCWVLTRRSLKVVHPGVTLTSESPAGLLADFRKKGIKRVWLVGGGQMAASFQSEHLIDQYMVFVMPVLLGSGISLLGSSGIPENLTLHEHRLYPNGVVELHYSRSR